jgi:cytidylate kinase
LASITIVSGCPGSGKTTLSSALADTLPNGLHILSDLFYEFPARPIDPTQAESHHQNTVIMRALGRAARTFAEGGYDVVLDGVIGPWFLPVLVAELGGTEPLSYVLLEISEAEAVARVRGREGPGASAGVRHMVAAFAEAPGFDAHRLDTRALSPEALLAVVRDGIAARRFALPPEPA